MPFAGYKDFKDCVAQNQDKSNPDAYCGKIQAAVEKAETEDRTGFTVAKLDPDQNLVFGWASIAVTVDGKILVDKQGDIIPPDELERAVYDFVLDFREADEMHNRVTKGHLVESIVFTAEKRAALGIPDGVVPTGWWVGFKVDADTFAKVKAGNYPMFSIEGTAQDMVPL